MCAFIKAVYCNLIGMVIYQQEFTLIFNSTSPAQADLIEVQLENFGHGERIPPDPIWKQNRHPGTVSHGT